MNNKILSTIGIILLFVSIFAVFITAVNAQGLNLLCSKKQNIIITLSNDANINKAKEEIAKIPQIKIINIKYRDKEWSRMVNKMDLPNMENPFKNEFIIKINKKSNIDEIFNKIKSMDFIENIDYFIDPKCADKHK